MWPQFPCKVWVNDDRDNWGISVTARLVALNKFGKNTHFLLYFLACSAFGDFITMAPSALGSCLVYNGRSEKLSTFREFRLAVVQWA